jgi:hypothetical protein
MLCSLSVKLTCSASVWSAACLKVSPPQPVEEQADRGFNTAQPLCSTRAPVHGPRASAPFAHRTNAMSDDSDPSRRSLRRSGGAEKEAEQRYTVTAELAHGS